MNTIISRKEASAQGLKRYFTGRPCKYGHIAERDTGAGRCFQCVSNWNSSTYQANPEKGRARTAKWRKENPERNRQSHLDQYLKHRGRYITKALIRRKRIQAGVFPHEKEAIRLFYQNCPEGYHVDHEIPLNHPLVCGLHCVANLQYLPAKENLAKSNHWSPDWNTILQ